MTAGREAIVADRLMALRALLARHDAGALLLATRRDFCWATLGGLSHVLLATDAAVAPLLVTRDEAVVLAPVNEHARLVEEELADLPIRAVSLSWWDPAATDREIERLAKGGRVLTERDLALELQALRSILVTAEHRRLAELGGQVVEAVNAALAGLRQGTSEHAVAAAAAAEIARGGARLPVIMVAADERIDLFRHPIPTSRTVERRVMVVVVAERWGLHVAHTAFRDLGPRTATEEKAESALIDVLAAMRDATLPGNTLGDVLEAAQAAYAANGMAEQWQLHHQGGTIGYGARERIATPDDDTLIRPGMAFAWNPSVVGHKLEETLYLDEAGERHVLTTTPVNAD